MHLKVCFKPLWRVLVGQHDISKAILQLPLAQIVFLLEALIQKLLQRCALVSNLHIVPYQLYSSDVALWTISWTAKQESHVPECTKNAKHEMLTTLTANTMVVPRRLAEIARCLWATGVPHAEEDLLDKLLLQDSRCMIRTLAS